MDGKTQMPPEEERFHANLVQLLQTVSKLAAYASSEGHDIVNPVFINIGITALQKLDKHELINAITLKSLPYWTQIHKKNQTFFIENARTVFSLWEGSTVDPFKVLFTAKKKNSTDDLVSEPKKSVLWLTMHVMVKIMIKYAHKRKTVDSSILSEQIKLWEIAL